MTEREIERKPLATDAKTGRGSLTFRVDDTQGGRYIVRVAGTDRFGNPIVADRVLTISGKKDETKLRLLADRQRFKVGEEASVNLHSRDRAGTALLTWEADRILSYKIVTLKEGDNTVAWAIDGPQFPNFTLTSTRMWRNECDQARLDIQVERDLRVTVAPAKPTVGPGEPVELEVTHRRPARPAGRGRAIDRDGRPVALAALQRPRCRRSARSSTTRPAPAPSRPRRPTRFAMRRRRCPFRRPWSTRPSARPPMAANEADRKDVMESGQATARSSADRASRGVPRSTVGSRGA